MAEKKKGIDKPRAFIQKWLPFVGVVIIFGGFVVREVLRDQYKDLAATVDSAESLFIMTDTTRVSPDLMKGQEDVNDKNLQEHVRAFFNTMHDLENYTRASIDTTKRLLKRLPGEEERIKELEKAELGFLKESSETNSEHTRALDKGVIEDRPSGGRQFSEEMDSFMRHFSKLFEMSLAVRKFSKDSLDIAETMREDAEYHYQVANYCSWGVFVVGLIVYVVGRIYGVEGLEVE